MARAAGILLHITSLPSPYGVGTLGREACRFLDFLERCGVKVWQILPWGPTGYGDSPYQSFSTFAGNPYLIDLEELAEEGLLEKEALAAIDWGEDPGRVDYEKLFAHRFAVLEKAFSQGFDPSEEGYRSFCQEQAHWLPDYALFMSIKEQYSQRPWWEWPRPLRLRDAAGLADFAQEHRGRIAFWQFVQYLFYRQWREMRAYAAARGVKILGDLPIYVAPGQRRRLGPARAFSPGWGRVPHRGGWGAAGWVLRRRAALGESSVPLGRAGSGGVRLVDQAGPGGLCFLRHPADGPLPGV